MKLTNTWKHLVVGALVGLIIGFIIKLFAVFELQWFCAFAFTLITIVWENNQRLRTIGEKIENESVSEKKNSAVQYQSDKIGSRTFNGCRS